MTLLVTVKPPVGDPVLTTSFLAILEGLKTPDDQKKRIEQMCGLLSIEDPKLIETVVQRFEAYTVKQAEARKAKEKADRAKLLFEKLNGRTFAEMSEFDDNDVQPGLALATEAVQLGMQMAFILKPGNPAEDKTVGQLICVLKNVPTAPGTAALSSAPARAPLVAGTARRPKRKFIVKLVETGEVIPNVAGYVVANFPDSLAAAYINHPNPPIPGLSLESKTGAFQAIGKDETLRGLFVQEQVG